MYTLCTSNFLLIRNISFSIGYQIITTPPPTGGAVLVSILNILEGYNFTKKDLSKNETYQVIVEVCNLQF